MQSKDGKIAIDYWEENQFEYMPMLLDTLLSAFELLLQKDENIFFSKCR